MKRPERSRYVIPALRYSKECEEKMKYAKVQYASEAANIQIQSLCNHGSSETRYPNITPRQVRFGNSSSSSNPINTSDESCEDVESSDFEECCSDIVSMNNLKTEMETNEDNSNDYWKEGTSREVPAKKEHGIKIENYETNTKISNRFLMQHKECSDLKSHSNQEPNSKQKNFDRGLFYDYGDSSLSDIEAVIDSYTKKGSVLTSTPNSDINDERVLDAAKYVTQGESAMESTLLGENDLLTTINTNRSDCDYNFEIYCDPPSVKKQPKDCSDFFGDNYIPPPVPPITHTFQLPPIHRLPSPVSSPYKLSVRRSVSIKQSEPRPVFLQPPVPRSVFFQPSEPRFGSFWPIEPSPVSPKPSVHRSVFQPSEPRSVFQPSEHLPAALQPSEHLLAALQPSEHLSASVQLSQPLPVSLQLSQPRPVYLQQSKPRSVSIQPFVHRSVFQPSEPRPASLQSSAHRSVFKPSEPVPVSLQPSEPRSSFPRQSVTSSIFSQHMPQMFTQLQHPRHLLPQSLQLNPDFPRRLPCKSSYVHHIPEHLSSTCMQPGSDPLPQDPTQMPFFIQPPQERVIFRNSPQAIFNPSKRESYKLDGRCYIPPPLPPAWRMPKSSDYIPDQRSDIRSYTVQGSQSCVLYTK